MGIEQEREQRFSALDHAIRTAHLLAMKDAKTKHDEHDCSLYKEWLSSWKIRREFYKGMVG